MVSKDLDEFAPVSLNGKTALVRKRFANVIAAALMTGEGCEHTGVAGRGDILRFVLEDRGGYGLIRRYRRGGVVRHFMTDTYLAANRPLRELRVMEYAYKAGLSVPEPLGACWQRTGLFIRGSFSCREVAGRDLQTYLETCLGTVHEDAPETLRACGKVVKEMHDSGIYHADLQLRNVIVSDVKVWLIDFDKAVMAGSVGRLRRAMNLLRFRRSFMKNGFPVEMFEYVCEGYGEISIPTWLNALYRVRGRVSDAVSRAGAQRESRNE